MLILIPLLSICSLATTAGSKNVEPKGAHVCQRIENYETQEQHTNTRLVSESYRYCCERFLLCMKYCSGVRYRTVSTTKNIPGHGHRIIKYCCEGWIQKDQECIPTCDFPCFHGTCIQPNFCGCVEGYTGKSCEKEIQIPTQKPVDKDSNNSQNDKNTSEDENKEVQDHYWSWLVPTVLFILLIVAIVIVYKRRQESIYKETLLVDKSPVQYNSLQNEAYSSQSFDIEDGKRLADKA